MTAVQPPRSPFNPACGCSSTDLRRSAPRWCHVSDTRVPPSDWDGVFKQAKALGLNCIQTYVTWSQHECNGFDIILLRS